MNGPPLAVFAALVLPEHRPLGILASSAAPGTQPAADALRRAAARAKDEAIFTVLTQVEAAVDAYLAQLGFDAAAVPFDYLDTPPRSLDAVQHNLDIVTHCAVDAFHATSQTQRALIQPLRRDMYARHLIPLVAELRALRQRAGLSAADRDTIDKDIAHLEKMRALEDSFLADEQPQQPQQRAAGPSDVVPVGGLVLSRLHRLENEMRTVLGHWSAGRRAQRC